MFNFTRLSELYGLAFAEYVGTAFVAVVASKTDVNKYLNRITHFLEWLADDELSTAIAKAVSHGGTIDTMQFEECAYRYQREVYFAYVGSADKKPGGQSHIAGFQVIEQLSEAGVFPRVRFPRITLRAFARRKTAATPSLAEARIEPGAQDVLRVAEAAASGDAPVDLGDDAVRFAETINLERQRRPDLPASLPAAIRAICEERLLALRRAASTVFEEWRKDYEWARGEIARAPHSGADASRMLEEAWASDNIMQGRQTVTRLFPPRDTTTALRQLLALIDANFGGICPQSNSLATSGFWEHAYSKVGGCPKVQALLTPTRQVCSAVTVLYLCETGANVSTALSLSPDSIQPSGISGHLSVVGIKTRSGGKPIYEHLFARSTAPDCTSAAEAIQYLAATTDAARRAAPQHANALFLHVRHGRVIVTNLEHIYRDLQPMAADSEELQHLHLTPSMIRPTVLLSAQLANPAGLDAVQLLARHESPTTTMGYVRKLPFRLILDQKIREFADTVEVIAARNIDDSQRRLGIDAVRWEDARNRARRTGLGVVCIDPKAGAQRDFPEGTTCGALDRCITCTNKLVVADAEAVADMIIWQKALQAAEETWLNTRHDRWESVWVPWRAFFEVVLEEKMERDELLVIKAEGKALAEQRMAADDFILPEPW